MEIRDALTRDKSEQDISPTEYRENHAVTILTTRQIKSASDWLAPDHATMFKDGVEGDGAGGNCASDCANGMETTRVYGNRTHWELCSNPPLVLKTRAVARRADTLSSFSVRELDARVGGSIRNSRRCRIHRL